MQTQSCSQEVAHEASGITETFTIKRSLLRKRHCSPFPCFSFSGKLFNHCHSKSADSLSLAGCSTLQTKAKRGDLL